MLPLIDLVSMSCNSSAARKKVVFAVEMDYLSDMKVFFSINFAREIRNIEVPDREFSPRKSPTNSTSPPRVQYAQHNGELYHQGTSSGSSGIRMRPATAPSGDGHRPGMPHATNGGTPGTARKRRRHRRQRNRSPTHPNYKVSCIF